MRTTRLPTLALAFGVFALTVYGCAEAAPLDDDGDDDDDTSLSDDDAGHESSSSSSGSKSGSSSSSSGKSGSSGTSSGESSSSSSSGGASSSSSSSSSSGSSGSGWTCEPAWKGDGEACDCGCGEHDPDCSSSVASDEVCTYCFHCGTENTYGCLYALDPDDNSQCL